MHFEEEACERGYAVIYVDGASNPNDATSSSGWNSGIASDGSAKHTKDPAIEDVMDYWAASNGLEHNEQTEIGKGSVLTKYSEADKETRVWNLQVKDGRHSWPEESLCGFDMNSLILEFLN